MKNLKNIVIKLKEMIKKGNADLKKMKKEISIKYEEEKHARSLMKTAKKVRKNLNKGGRK